MVRIPLPNPVNVRESWGRVRIPLPNPVNVREKWVRVRIPLPNHGDGRESLGEGQNPRAKPCEC